MSGVGITGKIVPLNDGAFPVFEDINGQGGWRAVADTAARNAIPANSRKIGMVVVTQDTGIAWQLVGGILDANWAPLAVFYQTVINTDGTIFPQQPNLEFLSSDFLPSDDPAVFATRIRLKNPVPTPGANGDVLGVVGGVWSDTQVQPFKATYHVDPGFAGTSNGSASNPFTTCAAAFTAALVAGLTSALILLPPGVNLIENVVFPSTGNDWEIACLHGAVGTVSAGITGTVTVTAAGTTRYRLTELFVTGLISGSNGGASQLILKRVRNTGGLTLTGSPWSVSLTGIGVANLNSFNGSSGAVSVAGTIFAANWVFNSSVAWSANPTQFDYCRFANGSITGNAASAAFFSDCIFVDATTITDSQFVMDGHSLASAMSVGLILNGAATLKTFNSNQSTQVSLGGNLGSTAFGGRNPVGLYECVFDATLITAGTTGAMQVNVIYTDLTGTLVTAPVGGTLNIASAAGTKSSGSLPFQHNGATQIAFSVTGVVAPGAMAVTLGIAVRRVN